MCPLIFVIDGTATVTGTATTLFMCGGSAVEEEEEEEEEEAEEVSRTAAAATATSLTNSLYKQIVLTLQNKHPVPTTMTANAKSP